ncbi:MAG: HEAT repeat domain-containing protein [Candidatus Eisenbacteria bacterium]|nr:HEAT repeat domain-containing protein [Candidatus Eisenbacteria bacterium]
MSKGTHETIAKLLAGMKASDIRKGLALAKKTAPRADKKTIKSLFDVLSTLFYIDPLDRPDLAPLLDEAAVAVARLGPDVIPLLVKELASGDVKAQMVAAKSLGEMGVAAVEPLIRTYRAHKNAELRSFVLYALGKIEAPEVVRAVPLALESARSRDADLRDTAVRALGKFAEAIPAGKIPKSTRARTVDRLRKNLADLHPGIRAKAVRSLGKLALHGHLTEEERVALERTCNLILGKDENFEWDRAYLVRREAEQLLESLQAEANDAARKNTAPGGKARKNA